MAEKLKGAFENVRTSEKGKSRSRLSKRGYFTSPIFHGDLEALHARSKDAVKTGQPCTG